MLFTKLYYMDFALPVSDGMNDSPAVFIMKDSALSRPSQIYGWGPTEKYEYITVHVDDLAMAMLCPKEFTQLLIDR